MNQSIMIVDDSPYIVDGLVALLKRKGYLPVAAYGGNECLEKLAAFRPDLILLDIMMEPMDGWEALEAIRNKPSSRDIPVLMFSAKKISAEDAGQHSMSIDDFIQKPVNPAQLLESIERIFKRRMDVSIEARRAKEAGLDDRTIEEYSTLMRKIEADKSLLAAVKASTGMDLPKKNVEETDRAAIASLEEKIRSAERRLREINELFPPNP